MMRNQFQCQIVGTLHKNYHRIPKYVAKNVKSQPEYSTEIKYFYNEVTRKLIYVSDTKPYFSCRSTGARKKNK